MKPHRFALWIILLALTPVPAVAQEAKVSEPTRSLDLSRNGRLFDQWFQRFGYRSGRTVAPEHNGVRFRIPAVKGAGIAGYNSAFSLDGDFEVRADYEIISMPPSTTGYGVSLGLTVDTGGPDGSVTLVRTITRDGKPEIVVMRATPGSTPGPENTKYDAQGFPTVGPRGRLVLRREKAEVICLATERRGGELKELKRVPFTTRPVRHLKFHADTGGSPTGVAGRLTGVHITADEIAGGLTRKELADAPSYWWWWIPVAVIALAAAWIVRRRRRAAAAEAG